jgi:hypothetical protein
MLFAHFQLSVVAGSYTLSWFSLQTKCASVVFLSVFPALVDLHKRLLSIRSFF